MDVPGWQPTNAALDAGHDSLKEGGVARAVRFTGQFDTLLNRLMVSPRYEGPGSFVVPQAPGR